MALFKSQLSRLSRKPTPVVATNMSLDAWCPQSHAHPTRFVQKVEICTALCAGEDAWGMPLGTNHHHTLLRVFLTPTRNSPRASEDTLLLERVLSTGGAHHSVTQIAEPLSTGGTLFHPDVHDRICAIAVGPSSKLAHDLVVERTLEFDDRALALAHFAQILAFVGRTTKMVCDGGDCKFQSRSFAFTCLTALGPSLPPRKAGQGMASKVGWNGSKTVDDSVFELSAEAFLGQVPWLVLRDPASMQALKLIGTLKDEPRDRTRARLYH